MQRKKAFSVLEFLIAIAVLGVLSVLIIFNGTASRARSRDANRRVSVNGYQTSFEQYKAKNGNYFVHGSDCTAPNGTHNVNGYTAYMEGAGTGCVGLYGGGAGRITRVAGATQNLLYRPSSIAQMLVIEGFLTQIMTDPLDAKKPTNELSERDFIVTLCNSNGAPALKPEDAKEFAIYMAPEGTPREVEQGTSKQLCAGPTTGYGWEYWLADAPEQTTTRRLAAVGTEPAQKANNTESTTTTAAIIGARPVLATITTSYSQSTSAIDGGFVVNNPSIDPIGNTYYTATLVYSPKEGEQQEIISRVVSDFISLSAKEDRGLTYSLPIPKTLNKGTYFIVIRGYSQTGVQIAILSKEVGITLTPERFLNIPPSESRLVFGTSDYRPLDAVTAPLGVRPSLRYVIRNPHDFPITGSVSLEVHARATLPGQLPIRRVVQEPVEIGAHVAQVVQMAMPESLPAESYLARVQVLDGEGNPISNFQDFRWVVAGEGGKVLSSTSSLTQTFAKTSGTVTAVLIGGADRSSVTNAKVLVEVYKTSDPSKKMLVKSEQTIALLTAKQQQIQVPLSFRSSSFSPLKNLTTRITLSNSSGTVLHQVESSNAVQLQRSTSSYAWIIALIVFLGLVISGLIARRNHRNHYLNPVSLVLIPLLLVSQFQILEVHGKAVVACIAAAPEGDPGVCQETWDANERPSVTVSQSFSTLNPTENTDVTITHYIESDPVNNATLTADFAVDEVISDPDPECLDDVALSITDISSGFWVTTVTAGSVGTTDLGTTAQADADAACWEDCGVGGATSTTVVCEVEVTTPSTTTTTPTTSTTTGTSTTGTTTTSTTTGTTTGTTGTGPTTGNRPVNNPSQLFIGVGSNHF